MGRRITVEIDWKWSEVNWINIAKVIAPNMICPRICLLNFFNFFNERVASLRVVSEMFVRLENPRLTPHGSSFIW